MSTAPLIYIDAGLRCMIYVKHIIVGQPGQRCLNRIVPEGTSHTVSQDFPPWLVSARAFLPSSAREPACDADFYYWPQQLITNSCWHFAQQPCCAPQPLLPPLGERPTVHSRQTFCRKQAPADDASARYNAPLFVQTNCSTKIGEHVTFSESRSPVC